MPSEPMKLKTKRRLKVLGKEKDIPTTKPFKYTIETKKVAPAQDIVDSLTKDR